MTDVMAELPRWRTWADEIAHTLRLNSSSRIIELVGTAPPFFSRAGGASHRCLSWHEFFGGSEIGAHEVLVGIGGLHKSGMVLERLLSLPRQTTVGLVFVGVEESPLSAVLEGSAPLTSEELMMRQELFHQVEDIQAHVHADIRTFNGIKDVERWCLRLVSLQEWGRYGPDVLRTSTSFMNFDGTLRVPECIWSVVRVTGHIA